ncbi:hypothetical protein IV55_GL001720 [Furfurilactobacillus siliginis]|uniref:Glycosyl transferase n=1 Tax=Furfurilactobacillus siliginis TaxID=348151 RepID=A0A0R2LBG2_9LACO|nr:hypothetical protein IV55_GL001720 [Furfurilactobacillus siliginis]
MSIESLIQHYESSEPLKIWVFNGDGFATDVVNLIGELPKRNGKPQISCAFWSAPDWTNEISRNVSERFPAITLWRLGLPFTFRECDQLLYLDVDTLIYADVNQLFDLVDPNVPLAAVPEIYHYMGTSWGQGVEADRSYVNSGVMVFNVQKYNEVWSLADFLRKVNENDFGRFPDQDLVNKQFLGQIQLLPPEYNLQQNNDFLTQDRELPVTEADKALFTNADKNVKIKHFLPLIKPSSLLTPVRDKYFRDWWQTARYAQSLFENDDV